MKIRKINNVSVVLLLLLISAFCSAQSQIAQPRMEQKTYKIVDIAVEGAKFADPQTVKAIAGIHPGEQLSFPGNGQDKLQTAIRNLWQRKQFSDVKIKIDKITEAGAFLVIQVKEHPRLNKIDIFGADEVSKEDIEKKVGKQQGEIFSKYDAYLTKRKIKKLYEEEGLMFAQIESDIEDVGNNKANLELSIDEGVEFEVGKISFDGNEVFEDDEIADELEETRTKSWWEVWRSDDFNLEEYEKDKENLISFYNQNGYVDAEITDDTLIYNEKNEEVNIEISLHEGDKLFVRNINFEGNTVYDEAILKRRLDFVKGAPYDLDRFEKNLYQNENQTDATSLYADNGYLAARFVPKEKRVPPDSVDLTIQVYENQRVKVRRVDIKGNTKTKDKVIRRELFTRPGDYFNRSAIIRSIRALGVMQYFNPEKLRPEIKPVSDKEVDLVYNVEERSTDQINASIGFMGTFGLTGSVGLTLNNFSLAEPFRGGAGQILNLHAEFGQANRYQQYSIGFTEPWLFDEPTTVGFNLYYSWIRYTYNLNIRRAGGAINLGRRFYWPDDYFRGDWSLRVQENYVRGDGGIYYRNGLTNEVTLGQRISRTSFNNLFFPSVGSKFDFSTNWAMGVLGLGNTDFFKNELKLEMAQPLMKIKGNDRLVLYLSSKVGYIATFQSDTMINPIELFSMGGNGLSGFGVTPLRGYPDHSIGPRMGGKTMARHIAELRFAISLDPMPIYFYGFAEAGNVWKDLPYTDPFNLKRSAGVGIQLRMNPIGIIGFSYGYGFDPTADFGGPAGWKFLFHLGQRF